MPATAPTPCAVVSTPGAAATARAPPPVRRSAMAGTRAMKGEAITPTTAMEHTADQQPGSPRATANPSRSEASRLLPPPVPGARRTQASAATTARNETALAAKATG